MGRKVFLSFLGSSNYGACRYYDEGFESEELRYIQEASLLNIGAMTWRKQDVALIMVTDGSLGSLKKNWEDNGHKDYNTKEVIVSEGLCSRLQSMNLAIQIEPVLVKDGNTKEEIWDIFQTVYDKLEEKDELYIDVTHGFRYLPMLSVVLANYAKFLKKIQVRHISYGNYEGRDRKTNKAPIINLISFSELQDWSTAASNFLHYGDAGLFSEISRKAILPTLKATKGKDQSASLIRNISQNMCALSDNMKVCRGKDIAEGKLVLDISQDLEVLKEVAIKPMHPILKKLKSEIQNLNCSNSVKNGLAAGRWCLKHRLIQQGLTILNEAVITLGVEQFEGCDPNNIADRDLISSCINLMHYKTPEGKWMVKDGKSIEDMRRIVQSDALKDIVNKYIELSDTRNDINHAGWRSNPMSLKKFEEKLEACLSYFEKLTEDNNHANQPL